MRSFAAAQDDKWGMLLQVMTSQYGYNIHRILIIKNKNKIGGFEMKKLMNWLKNEESGQGMVEYALIIVAIALVVILVLPSVGDAISDKFEEIETELTKTP